MSDQQFRAEFDARVEFANGGHLAVAGFRVDVPGPDVTEAEVGALFVASLGLLLSERVELVGLRVFPEAHKGTRGGPSAEATVTGELVDLSHVIKPGMITYPGLPAPEITPHFTRAQTRATYAGGAEFAIDRISMVGNTGTYLDTPFHRYPEGHDLSGLPLARVAGVPTVVVRTAGSGTRGVDVGSVAPFDVAGKAVLLHTGGDRDFGTPAYAENAPFLTEAAARWLVEHDAALVGIDSVNIDDVDDKTRPAHSILLAADIPIVEHLTGLDQLPVRGARFSAVPPKFAEFGTFSVRAFAVR
ncbi:MAG TPA: cyclase family protein [Pseudonocardiaceae bacterium]|jgi:kynurenine formamidase